MFNYVNEILYKQKESNFNNVDEDKEFQPFLIQRWCTMHSTPVAELINMSSNRYWSTYTSNKEWFIALKSTIPACKFKRLNYLKKNKKVALKNKDNLNKIANNLEISSRELNLYIEQFNLQLFKNEEKFNIKN